MSGSVTSSKSNHDEIERKEIASEINLKKFEDLKLRRGFSDKTKEKDNMRNTSASISQLSNYTSTC